MSQYPKIPITPREPLQDKPTDESALGFGRVFTDHMLKVDYDQGEWQNPRIEPYGPLSIDPANSSLHYGQLIFEGMKAYRTPQGELALFRPRDNFKRLNVSANRFCMPEMDVDKAVDALEQLILLEQDWIPHGKGTSLYIRPFTIAVENFLGVRPASKYLFMVILSPVGNYYKEGIAPIGIYVEDEYVRAAARGGTGYTKTAGNYAASLIAQEKAQKQGYTQVLWLDSNEGKYVEEIGTSNAFFVIDGEVITPALGGSILPGLTRDSAIQLLKHWGIPVTERRLTIDEVEQAHSQGRLDEAFATGTAAVISPVGELKYKDHVMTVGEGVIGPIAQRLHQGITGIQQGIAEDPFGWHHVIKK